LVAAQVVAGLLYGVCATGRDQSTVTKGHLKSCEPQ
jgi:hypothetical protein